MSDDEVTIIPGGLDGKIQKPHTPNRQERRSKRPRTFHLGNKTVTGQGEWCNNCKTFHLKNENKHR